MKNNILIDPETNNVTIKIDAYESVYSLKELDRHFNHEALADAIAKDEDLETCMLIIEAEDLADEHWDDPAFMHKTNNLICCEALEEARKEMMNRYFRGEELTKFMQENELPDWRYNYQEDDEKRRFKFEVEDTIFEYQELIKMVENVAENLKSAETYTLDEYGYVLYEEDLEDEDKKKYQFDEEGYALVTDKEVIRKQKDTLLHRLLRPRVRTTHERVYAMPSPFNHWDYRSFWHQFFLITNKKTGQVLIERGNSGSSGARETNGRWAHTFATLSNMGIETPTFHLVYDQHNQLKFKKKYESFRLLPYDVSGNYFSDHETTDRLFKPRIVTSLTFEDRYSKYKVEDEEPEV